MYRDDEKDLHVSPSSPDYFKPNEKEELKKKVEKQKEKKERHQLKLNVLKQQISNDEKKRESFGTKTRDQESKKEIESAQQENNLDALMKEAERQQAAMEQAAIEEQADQNG